jgi:hypothetical protein
MNQDDILRLDVTMKDFVVVQVGNGVEKITDYEGCALLGQGLTVLYYVVQLAALSELQDRVEVLRVLEEPVYFRYVRVL